METNAGSQAAPPPMVSGVIDVAFGPILLRSAYGRIQSLLVAYKMWFRHLSHRISTAEYSFTY